MNAILNLGKWLFAVPFLVFGVFHFLGAKDMAGMAPFGGEIMVYITGAALVAAAVSMFIGKYDKLATVLLALMLILFIVFIHGPAAGDSSNQSAMPSLLKDLALAGAALLYAKNEAKDNSIIG
jgi:uncharacterized membrane protein